MTEYGLSQLISYGYGSTRYACPPYTIVGLGDDPPGDVDMRGRVQRVQNIH